MICLRQRGCPVICASLVLVGRAHGRSPEAFFVRRRGEHLHVAADADVTVARETQTGCSILKRNRRSRRQDTARARLSYVHAILWFWLTATVRLSARVGVDGGWARAPSKMQVLSLPIYRNPIASRRNHMSSEHTPYFTLNSIVYIGQRTLHLGKRYLNSHTATRHVVFCQSESSPPADITPPQADDPFCSSTDHQDLGHGDNRGAMLLPYNWAAPGVSQPHRTHLVANHRPTALRLNTNPAL